MGIVCTGFLGIVHTENDAKNVGVGCFQLGFRSFRIIAGYIIVADHKNSTIHIF